MADTEPQWEVVKADGRHYRRIRTVETFEEEEDEVKGKKRLELDEGDDVSGIIQDGNGYVCHYPVPAAFLKFIVGKKASTKKKIELETKTRLGIPRPEEPWRPMEIQGRNTSSVARARDQIELIMENAKRLMRPTHFLSLPLGLSTAFEGFKEQVLEMGAKGVNESIFISSQKLHLTLMMLKLFSEEEVKKARGVLQSFSESAYEAVKTRSLLVNIAGLDYMNDDPSEVDVLYAKVEEVGGERRLNALCAILRDGFKKAGLMLENERPLKLHATLLNTRYGISEEQGQQGQWKKRKKFDARPILEMKVDFGTTRLASVHLSSRHSVDSDTGFYACEGSIALP